MTFVISHSDPGAVPGASTKLHQLQKHAVWRGRNRIDEGVKTAFSFGMVSTVIGLNLIVANDNYAEARLAA